MPEIQNIEFVFYYHVLYKDIHMLNRDFYHTQRYWFTTYFISGNIVQVMPELQNAEYGFYYNILQKDIDLLNLELNSLLTILLELYNEFKIWNLVWITRYCTKIYWYAESAMRFINGNIIQDMPEIQNIEYGFYYNVLQKDIVMQNLQFI